MVQIDLYTKDMDGNAIDEADKAKITQAFHIADDSLKGFLTVKDIKIASINLLGYKLSKYEINQMCSLSNIDARYGSPCSSPLTG